METFKTPEISQKDRRTEKRRIGDSGEDIACLYLRKKGHKILERNFYCSIGEIDIISFDPQSKTIVFTEVKTRKNIDYGLPCEFVNARKQRLLKSTAEYYILLNKGFLSFNRRMDIIEILQTRGGTYIRHLTNAF